MGRGPLGWRIARQPGNMKAHEAAHQPVDVAYVTTLEAGEKLPPMAHMMPLSIVTVTGDTMQVEEATPLYTSRGVVPATGTGQWDQLRAAGNI